MYALCIMQIVVDKTNQPWVVYDAGPRHVHSPLVCLPPVCGTADVFFRQLLNLSQAGYRVISVNNNTVEAPKLSAVWPLSNLEAIWLDS